MPWKILLNLYFFVALSAPNPKCYVCAAKPEVVLKVDTETMTVKELRDDILIKELNMMNPDVLLDGKGVIVISSEEGETECNEDKILKDLAIVDGCILKVDDFFQEYELTVTIIHQAAERDGPKFQVIADKDTLKPTETPIVESKKEEPQPSTSAQQSSSSGSSSNGVTTNVADDSDDDLMLVEDDEDIVEPAAEKRKFVEAKDDEDESPTCKRARVDIPPEVPIVPPTIQDDDDDIVCIDDD